MERRLWDRVRWGNVGRALGVVIVVGVVAAWPVLAPEAPRVPAPAVVPVATPTAVPPRVRPTRPTRPARRPPERRQRNRTVVRGERPAGEGDGGSRRGVRRPAVQVVRRGRRAGEGGGDAEPAPPPPVPAASPPAATANPVPQGEPAPADPDPVVREFSFEAG